VTLHPVALRTRASTASTHVRFLKDRHRNVEGPAVSERVAQNHQSQSRVFLRLRGPGRASRLHSRFSCRKKISKMRRQEITDEVRVTIAAQACLLCCIANRLLSAATTILVYPSIYSVTRAARSRPRFGRKARHRVSLARLGAPWFDGAAWDA